MLRAVCTGLLLATAVTAVGGSGAAGSFPGRDGRIAITGLDLGCGIHTVTQTGQRRRAVYEGCVSPASFSPGGRRLLFAEQRGDAVRRLLTIRADGRRLRRHTQLGWNPSWSPGGRTVAYIEAFGLPDASIWRARLDGSRRKRLTSADSPPFAGDGGVPRWSPDGRAIAHLAPVRAEGGGIERAELRLIDSRTGAPIRVLARSAAAFDFAPDGQRLVYQEPRVLVHPQPGDCEIRVVRADGTGATRKVADACGVTSLAWSPDASHIAYALQRAPAPGAEDPVTEVYRVRAAGGTPRRILRKRGDVDDGADVTLSWQARRAARPPR
jgi:Tol biopolymer transport system component